MSDGLPYRPCVGAALFSAKGEVLVARRVGPPDPDGAGLVWQMPQGGIDDGEDPRAAVMRELREEIGTDRATILGEHPDWLTYDLPPHLIGRALRGRFRGQRQKWFALRFDGVDADIRLDADPHPEFAEWRWAPLASLPALAVPFKRAVYEAVAANFARFARTGVAPD